jgi:hypothetical protein
MHSKSHTIKKGSMIEEEAHAGYKTVLTYSYYDDDSIQD